MVHHKGSNGTFAVLTLADLPQAEVYRDSPLCRRRMYTAVSRATHRVTALSQGPVTPLLPSLRG